MARLINIDVLHPDIRVPVQKYFNQIINVFQEDITSMFVYGSATGRNYIPGTSDINIAVILKEM